MVSLPSLVRTIPVGSQVELSDETTGRCIRVSVIETLDGQVRLRISGIAEMEVSDIQPIPPRRAFQRRTLMEERHACSEP